jgi:hypothetical protein
MLEAFNNRFRRLQLSRLVVFYLVLFLLYVLLPATLYVLKGVISPLMAVTLFAIVYRAILGSSS